MAPMAMVLGVRSASRTHGLLYMRVEQWAPMAMVLGVRSASRTHGLLYMRVEQWVPMAMVLGVRSTSRTHGLLYIVSSSPAAAGAAWQNKITCGNRKSNLGAFDAASML